MWLYFIVFCLLIECYIYNFNDFSYFNPLVDWWMIVYLCSNYFTVLKLVWCHLESSCFYMIYFHFYLYSALLFCLMNWIPCCSTTQDNAPFKRKVVIYVVNVYFSCLYPLYNFWLWEKYIINHLENLLRWRLQLGLPLKWLSSKGDIFVIVTFTIFPGPVPVFSGQMMASSFPNDAT